MGQQNGDKEQQLRINDDIRVPRVRLIDEQGEQVGIVSVAEALSRAEAAQLDLVEISSTASPPVCKIMDYGKYRYEQRKRQSEAKKRQKQVTVKEVKMRPNTGASDYNVKLRKLREFLHEGNRVKVSVWFRGREIVHKDIGETMLARVTADIGDEAVVEQAPHMEGRQMVMLLLPGKETKKNE